MGSSSGGKDQSGHTALPSAAPRRFTPQMVDPYSSTSCAAPHHALVAPLETLPSRRKFQVQPLEVSITSSRSSRISEKDNAQYDPALPEGDTDQASDIGSIPSRRRFAPQLVGTTSRRRKSTDSYPCIQQEDKTDFSPGDHVHLPKHMELAPLPTPPTNSPVASSDQIPRISDSRFSSQAISRRNPRNHSFRVPELPMIQSTIEESESSDKSKVPSLSTSPPADSDGTVTERKLVASVPQVEALTDRGSLVSYAARMAEKQLREQVFAAYPNEHDNERVHHFAAESSSHNSDDEQGELVHRSDQASFRKKSTHEHLRESEQNQQGMRAHGSRNAHHGQSRLGSGAQEHERLRNHVAVRQSKVQDQEMKVMRKAASPPMAGQSLQFRKCQSPQNTRLDCCNHPNAPTKLTRDRDSPGGGGLWRARKEPSRRKTGRGLWMGVCGPENRKNGMGTAPLQRGILTPPAIELQDPMEAPNPPPSDTSLTPTPPSSQQASFPTSLNSILVTEDEIDREFPDEFVTILYDYCSLGYPSMARKYDEELSKITQIPIEKIRKDDDDKSPRGHIGVHYGLLEGFKDDDDDEMKKNGVKVPEHDERWWALRRYVREWARQSPQLLGQPGRRDWGESTRKGSWAI